VLLIVSQSAPLQAGYLVFADYIALYATHITVGHEQQFLKKVDVYDERR